MFGLWLRPQFCLWAATLIYSCNDQLCTHHYLPTHPLTLNQTTLTHHAPYWLEVLSGRGMDSFQCIYKIIGTNLDC